MRIVLTVHQFLPEFSFGTEIVTLRVAQELRRRGHDVSVVTGFPAAEPVPDDLRFDRYRYDGLAVERFYHNWEPMGEQHNRVECEYDNHLFRRFFAGHLRRERPDLVHFFHLSRLSGSAIDACLELGLPTLFTATDFWAVCPYSQLRRWDDAPCAGPDPQSLNCVRHMAWNIYRNQPRRQRLLAAIPDRILSVLVSGAKLGVVGGSSAPLVRALIARPVHLRGRLNRLHRIVAPSRVMRERLIAHGVEPSRIVHLPYGIKTDGIRRSADRGSEPVLRLGYLGSLSEHKGCHLLVQAVRSLPASAPVELRLYGPADDSEGYLTRLLLLAQDDPRIRFCKPFDNSEVGQILDSIDVLVVPSIWYENTPVVIYEALAAGCAVLASDVSGIAEIIVDGENGRLFQSGSAPALEARIRELAADRGQVRRLAGNTRPPLSVAEHVTALEALYAEVTHPEASAPSPEGNRAPRRENGACA